MPRSETRNPDRAKLAARPIHSNVSKVEKRETRVADEFVCSHFGAALLDISART